MRGRVCVWGGTFHHLMVGSCHLSNQEFLADFGVAKVNHLRLHFRSPSSCIREKTDIILTQLATHEHITSHEASGAHVRELSSCSRGLGASCGQSRRSSRERGSQRGPEHTASRTVHCSLLPHGVGSIRTNTECTEKRVKGQSALGRGRYRI